MPYKEGVRNCSGASHHQVHSSSHTMARVFLALVALCVAAQAVLASNEDRRDDRLHQDDYLADELHHDQPAVLRVQPSVIATRPRPAVVASRPRPAVLAPRSRPAVIESHPAVYTDSHIEDQRPIVHLEDPLQHYDSLHHVQLVQPDDHYYVALPHPDLDDFEPRRRTNERRRKNRKGSGSDSSSDSDSDSNEKRRRKNNRNDNRNNNRDENRQNRRIQRLQRVQRPVLVSQPLLSQPLRSQPLRSQPLRSQTLINY